ncbi:hypothetical protein CSUI_010669 [Cystoisospora suis]|uniref:Uncharacterized protein n=1 Tax=Cystoisospora suis TaxID=483139 RepID=A0A2C6JWQ7_9APIC|nr:hypothetical protein CSUI_010669 [Cystoisospora suis]
MLVSASVYGEILAEEQAEEQLLAYSYDFIDYHNQSSCALPSPSSSSSLGSSPESSSFSGFSRDQAPFLVRHLLQEEKSFSTSVRETSKEDFPGGSRRSSQLPHTGHDLAEPFIRSSHLAGVVETNVEELGLLARRLYVRDVALATAAASIRKVDTKNTVTRRASGEGDHSQIAAIDREDKGKERTERKESSGVKRDDLDLERGHSQQSDFALVKQTAKKVVTESVSLACSIQQEESASNGISDEESLGQPVESSPNSAEPGECVALSGASLCLAFVSSPRHKSCGSGSTQVDSAIASTSNTVANKGDESVHGSSLPLGPPAARYSCSTPEEDSCPYWCVNTFGCSTTRPVFHVPQQQRTSEPVSLLEEAEAFVARAASSAAILVQKDSRQLRGSQQIPGLLTLRQAPRHLAVYVAEVSCRAYFDPQYRAQLINKYTR